MKFTTQNIIICILGLLLVNYMCTIMFQYGIIIGQASDNNKLWALKRSLKVDGNIIEYPFESVIENAESTSNEDTQST